MKNLLNGWLGKAAKDSHKHIPHREWGGYLSGAEDGKNFVITFITHSQAFSTRQTRNFKGVQHSFPHFLCHLQVASSPSSYCFLH